MAIETPGERVLRSIGLEEAKQFSNWVNDPGSGHFLEWLINEDIARSLWRKWVPDDVERIERADFREAFRLMVADFVSLGLNVEHLRDVARMLPEPSPDRRNWISLFEEAVSGREKCKLRVILSPSAYRDCIKDKEENGEKWSNMISMMRDGLFYELGITYPVNTLHSDETLAENEFRVEWNDVELPARAGIARDRLIVTGTDTSLARLGITGEKATNPANGSECALVDISHRQSLKDKGYTTWTWMGYIILSVSADLRRAAPAFVNRYLIEYYLNSLAQVWPDLVEDVRARLDRDELVQVIRGLLAEEISVRDLRNVLESMLLAQVSPPVAEAGIVLSHPVERPFYRTPASRAQPTVADYLEYVRGASAKYISHKYTRGEATLNVYDVSPPVEERLGQREEITMTEVTELLGEVRTLVAELAPGLSNPVVLTSVRARRRLRLWISSEFPHLAVLSHNEILPAKQIIKIGTLSPEIKPYDESFDRMLKAGSDVIQRKVSERLPPRDAAADDRVVRILIDHRATIVSGVIKEVTTRYPMVETSSILNELVERYLDGYGDLLTTGRLDRFDETVRLLSLALRAEGTRCSNILSIAFDTHQQVCNLMLKEIDGNAGDDGVRLFNTVLDRTAKAAHRLVEALRDKCVGRSREGANP